MIRIGARTYPMIVVVLGVLTMSACQPGGGAPTVAPTAGTVASTGATQPVPQGCPPPAVGPVDAGSVLVPGPSNGLPASDARGEKLVIVGVVLDPACQPAVGASVHLWHTDAHGNYAPPGSEACCYYAGTVRTDQNGRFRVETIRPGQYPQGSAPPAHIHLEIRHGSGGLQTEIVFADAPLPSAPARPSHEVPVYLQAVSSPPSSWYGEVVFVLE